jgi:hypothetical protein
MKKNIHVIVPSSLFKILGGEDNLTEYQVREPFLHPCMESENVHRCLTGSSAHSRHHISQTEPINGLSSCEAFEVSLACSLAPRQPDTISASAHRECMPFAARWLTISDNEAHKHSAELVQMSFSRGCCREAIRTVSRAHHQGTQYPAVIVTVMYV